MYKKNCLHTLCQWPCQFDNGCSSLPGYNLKQIKLCTGCIVITNCSGDAVTLFLMIDSFQGSWSWAIVFVLAQLIKKHILLRHWKIITANVSCWLFCSFVEFFPSLVNGTFGISSWHPYKWCSIAANGLDWRTVHFITSL